MALNRFLIRSAVAISSVVFIAGAAGRASADTIKVQVSAAPDWGLGSPQGVLITGCSNVDPALCPVLLGGGSDFLSLTVLTRPTISDSLTECNELNNVTGNAVELATWLANGCGPAPLFWPALAGGGAIDLIIPNANWIFPRVYVWTDSPAETLVSDGLVFFNWGTTAQLWLGSNWFDPPSFPSPADLPDLFPGLTLPDPITLGGSPFNADGRFTLTDVPMMVPAPEPASLVLLGSGLLAAVSRLRRSGRVG